jgi:flagellar hook-basal body protein
MGDVRINAKSTLSTLNKWIEVTSGNLTGAQIYGYKGTRISFGDTLVDTIRNGTGTTTIGGLNPIQLPSGGISVGATATDFRQGSIVQTGDNNNLAISGNAWFAVANPAGSINYTRNGEFHFDDSGNFVAANGDFVLGVFDATKGIVPAGGGAFVTTTEAIGIALASNGLYFGSSVTGSAAGMIPIASSTNLTDNLSRFLDESSTGDQDRVVASKYMGSGQIMLGDSVGNMITSAGAFNMFTISGLSGNTVAVTITLDPGTNNKASNTAYDNALLVQAAVNAVSASTGVGCSVVRDRKDPLGKVALVFCHVQRALTEDYTNFTEATNPSKDLKGKDVGVLGNFTDNQGNVYHKVNIKTLVSSSPEYRPLAGDKFSFDGTGQLINNSRGKDATSAPPFASGVHVAIAKFSNQDGLSKTRGSSYFTYSDAAGQIITGYAGQVRSAQVDKKLGLEISGNSTIGAENTVIPQSLESSNTSITDMLPELTIAQKTFTSNSKVVNVGNSIVDDLNGLIR